MCVGSISILFWCELGSRPLSTHGLWNCQAHFIEIRQPRVLASSIAPSPHKSVTFERRTPGVTIQDSGDDGSKFRG